MKSSILSILQNLGKHAGLDLINIRYNKASIYFIIVNLY